MADEDNFDIDIYGDDPNPDYPQDKPTADAGATHQADNLDDMMPESTVNPTSESNGPGKDVNNEHNEHNAEHEPAPSRAESGTPTQNQQQIASTGGSTQGHVQPPKQAPIQQGVKRKEGADDRNVDPGATPALLISELNWWNTEDDIRGWANQSGCEDEMKEVTFNEHKVNGKSKGYVPSLVALSDHASL